MSGKGQTEACARFEPQAWRKNLCKNCFKTRPQHEATAAGVGEPESTAVGERGGGGGSGASSRSGTPERPTVTQVSAQAAAVTVPAQTGAVTMPAQPAPVQPKPQSAVRAPAQPAAVTLPAQPAPQSAVTLLAQSAPQSAVRTPVQPAPPELRLNSERAAAKVAVARLADTTPDNVATTETDSSEVDVALDTYTTPVATAVAAAFAASGVKPDFSGANAASDASVVGATWLNSSHVIRVSGGGGAGESGGGGGGRGGDGDANGEAKISPARPGVHSAPGSPVSETDCATRQQADTAPARDAAPPGRPAAAPALTTRPADSLDDVNNLKNRGLSYHAPAQQHPAPVFISAAHGTTHEEFAAAKKELCAARRRQRRRRQSAGDIRRPPDGTEVPADGRATMSDVRAELNRKEAMREGARLLLDNMREKVIVLEDRTERLVREKTALGELLAAKKRDCSYLEEESAAKVANLEEQLRRACSEKNRLVDRLRLPESERSSLAAGEQEMESLRRRLEEADQARRATLDDNGDLRQEVRDLQLEMDEMADQFRDDEAVELRDLQKELETAAKNCRILQFKLRRTERRADQLEAERAQQGEAVRRLEQRGGAAVTSGGGPPQPGDTRRLEEELRLANDVTGRLHDELDLVEEKRARYEEELGRVNDLLAESESRRHGMLHEMDMMEVSGT